MQALDYESRGIWFEILLIMFESEKRGKLALNGRPMEDEELAHYLGLDVAKVQQTVSKLVSKGVAKYDDENYLMNRRMVYDDKLRLIRAKAGSQGGKQKASKVVAKGKQKSTPSVSPSTGPAAPFQLQASPLTTETKTKKGLVPRKIFQPPTTDEVAAYTQSIQYELNPEKFVDYYQARGWSYGHGKPMKDWKAAVREWRRRDATSTQNKNKMEKIIAGAGVDLE